MLGNEDSKKYLYFELTFPELKRAGPGTFAGNNKWGTIYYVSFLCAI